jgi:hypothetical protein
VLAQHVRAAGAENGSQHERHDDRVIDFVQPCRFSAHRLAGGRMVAAVTR